MHEQFLETRCQTKDDAKWQGGKSPYSPTKVQVREQKLDPGTPVLKNAMLLKNGLFRKILVKIGNFVIFGRYKNINYAVYEVPTPCIASAHWGGGLQAFWPSVCAWFAYSIP